MVLDVVVMSCAMTCSNTSASRVIASAPAQSYVWSAADAAPETRFEIAFIHGEWVGNEDHSVFSGMKAMSQPTEYNASGWFAKGSVGLEDQVLMVGIARFAWSLADWVPHSVG